MCNRNEAVHCVLRKQRLRHPWNSECTSQRDAWKLALTAQKNGAYTAAFEPLTRSAARADILNEYETAAAQPAAVAKQLGRLVKHRLQK